MGGFGGSLREVYVAGLIVTGVQLLMAGVEVPVSGVEVPVAEVEIPMAGFSVFNGRG